MRVLVIGAMGNMGRRYRTILTYLGHEWVGVDVGVSMDQVIDHAFEVDGIIIATPTETHGAYICALAHVGKPILCEKPITKDLMEMATIARVVKHHGTNLTMVMQYKELLTMPSIGWTYYNYWNTGKDGLIWDCIQIIGLARSDISIQNDSPVWRCRINGRSLNLADMDRAYIKMVAGWLKKPGQDIDEIQAIHHKVDAFERSVKSARD
jgi:hypothetical protein